MDVTSTDQDGYRSTFSHADEHAEPGDYRVHLDRYDTDVELTATTRTGWQRYGFPATEFHQVIEVRVREADALGRFGSDGFIATLPHTDEAGAATFADALRHRLALRPVAIGEAEVPITVSIGVATMRPGEDLDVDGLLARVGEALDSARSARPSGGR